MVLLRAALVPVLGFHLAKEISVVNIKCDRLPAMISNLNFGHDVDLEKHVAVMAVTTCEPGFLIYGVRLTRGAVLKVCYVALVVTVFVVSRVL